MAKDIFDLGLSYTEKRERVRSHILATRAEPAPRETYRAELFRRVQNTRYGSNVSRLGVREIAADTNLSVGTITDALKGKATKVETLWKLSRYFGVPWFLLFDIDRRYLCQVTEDGTAVEYEVDSKFITPYPGDSVKGKVKA